MLAEKTLLIIVFKCFFLFDDVFPFVYNAEMRNIIHNKKFFNVRSFS